MGCDNEEEEQSMRVDKSVIVLFRQMADDLADALFEGMSEEEVKAFMEQVEAMGQRARRLNQRQERLKAQEINK